MLFKGEENVTGTRESLARALTQQEKGVACYSTVLLNAC
jgi:hypothetical protein